MLWRVIGAGSLVWGGIVFYILSTTPLPSHPNINIPAYPNLEFTISTLSVVWLISSSLVKIGMILKKNWTRVSIISCLCFVFLLINMGIIQANIQSDKMVSPNNNPYPYNLIAAWLVSWFWIDLFLIMISFMNWIRKKWNLV